MIGPGGLSFFTRPGPRHADLHPGGRPRRHGTRLSCADDATRPEPDTTTVCPDDVYGQVQVAAWHQLHPHQYTYRDPDGAMSIIEGTLIQVQVTHLPGRRHREPKTLWLWWHGPDPSDLDLDRVWRTYLRRFDIEHTFRFIK